MPHRLIPLLSLFSLLSLSGESQFKDTPYKAQTPLASELKYSPVPQLLFNNIIKALESGEVVDAALLRKYRGNLRRAKGKLSKDQADRVWALYDKYSDTLMGSRKKKNSKTNSIAAVSLEASRATLFGYLFQMVPPHMMNPVKLMNDFPKLGDQKVVRINRMMYIDPGVKRWRSTGLYLKPGDVLAVKVAAAVVNKGISIRVGCHKDNITRRDDWYRWPEITVSTPIENKTTYIANPWGGLVYVEVSKDTPLTKEFAVTLSGAFESPYVMSSLTLSGWKQMLETSPSPFAELESSRVVLTFPTEALKLVDDPGETKNLIDEYPVTARRLRKKLEKWLE